LVQEGLARELVSRVQRLRKDAGYDVSTRIVLAIHGADAVLEAARAHREHVAGETPAREFVIGGALDAPDRIEPVVIETHAAALAVRRHGEGRTDSGPGQADRS